MVLWLTQRKQSLNKIPEDQASTTQVVNEWISKIPQLRQPYKPVGHYLFADDSVQTNDSKEIINRLTANFKDEASLIASWPNLTLVFFGLTTCRW